MGGSETLRKGTVKVTASLSNAPSVLLATASSGGTIASVRFLGRNGFKVGVLSSQRLGAAAWSNCAARTFRTPPESESQHFIERLLAIGASNPGQILLPTSDETVWLYTLNANELQRYFRIALPSLPVLLNILDKKRFADAVVRAGLGVLPSWDPGTIDEVVALAPTLPYPILIKPRTHVHRLRNDKGIVVYSASELKNKYQQYIDREQAAAGGGSGLREASRPILQQFVCVGGEGVYSVTGFIDRTGELFVTRSAIKVFQRSQPVGVGVCFEFSLSLQRCRTLFAGSAASSVTLEFSKSSSFGSRGAGLRSTSTRACSTRSGWTSGVECHCHSSPVWRRPARLTLCAKPSRRRGNLSTSKPLSVIASLCEQYSLLKR